jgi:hypothetical protein
VTAYIKFPEVSCKTCRKLVLRDFPGLTVVKGSFPKNDYAQGVFAKLYLKHAKGIEHEVKAAFPDIHDDVCDSAVAEAMRLAQEKSIVNNFRGWVKDKAKNLVIDEIRLHHHKLEDNVNDALWLNSSDLVSDFVPQDDKGPDCDITYDLKNPDNEAKARSEIAADGPDHIEQALRIGGVAYDRAEQEVPEPHRKYPTLHRLIDRLRSRGAEWAEVTRKATRPVVISHWWRSLDDGELYPGKQVDLTIPLRQGTLEYHDQQAAKQSESEALEAGKAAYWEAVAESDKYKDFCAMIVRMSGLSYVPSARTPRGTQLENLTVVHGRDADGKAIKWTLAQMRPYGLWCPWNEPELQRAANEGRFAKSPWQDDKWCGTHEWPIEFAYHYGLWWAERELWAEGEEGASAYGWAELPPYATRRSQAARGLDYEGDAYPLGATLMQGRCWRDRYHARPFRGLGLGEMQATEGILDTPAASPLYWPGPWSWIVDENEKRVTAIRLSGYLGCYCYDCTRGQHSVKHPTNHAGFTGRGNPHQDLPKAACVERPKRRAVWAAEALEEFEMPEG